MPKIFEKHSMPFVLKVASGWYDDMESLDKFGINPLITPTSDPEDIWEGGDAYVFSNTADIVSISSSNATDTQTISVRGLDVDGIEVTQDVTLIGQTRVPLTIALLRVYRLENESAVDLLGTVYCYSGMLNTAGVPSGGSIEKARIVIGNNQTQMAIYTIPKNKVGFFMRGEVGMQFTGSVGAGTNFARCTYRSRRPGGVFKVKKTITLINQASSIFQEDRAFPDVLPGMIDIKMVVEEVSDDMGIWASFDILLVDKVSFSDEFLTAIGQP